MHIAHALYLDDSFRRMNGMENSTINSRVSSTPESARRTTRQRFANDSIQIQRCQQQSQQQ